MNSIVRLSRRGVRIARLVLAGPLVLAVLTTGAAWAANGEAQPEPVQEMSTLDRINHIVVIYQENHSFDNYLGTLPGVDGVADAGAAVMQTDRDGQPYDILPAPLANPVDGIRQPLPSFPSALPNRPFLMNDYARPEDGTANMVHAFYRQQYQINGGRMDRFVAWTDAGGLVMGHWDLQGYPLYELAREFTVADRFFMAAFGGSFLNHQWLICACTPIFPNAPDRMRAAPLPGDPDHMLDKQVTPDGYVVNHETANPSYSVNGPRPADADPDLLVPSQTAPTIGDRLSDAGVDWAWYSGGWNDAVAGNPDPRFQFHHQPFTYYEQYAAGTTTRAMHLKDEHDFFAALDEGHLPAVSFVKPIGLDNEHPSYTTVARGEQHLLKLVDAVRKSSVWPDTLIVITYDDNGGQWDHVAPPVVDRWGPGVRVPTVIVSPLAKRGYVDHTTYDTTSLLRTIERRWRLAPLGTRDAAANDLTSALQDGAAD